MNARARGWIRGRRGVLSGALGLALLAGAVPALGEEGGAEDARARFGAEFGRFAGALSAAAEVGLDAVEAWDPDASPPGALGDLIERLAALPLAPDASPRVAALVASEDAFLQEAGLLVARGQLRQGIWREVSPPLEEAAARALGDQEVDPWVVLAAVELVEAAPEGPLEALLGALAEVAARGPAQERAMQAGPSASRMRPVGPEAYARLDALLGRWLGRAGAADARILAHLSRRHGTEGAQATRQAAQLEAALRTVHEALAAGDRRAAAWALEQARPLAAQGPRARELEALATLVGPHSLAPRSGASDDGAE